MENKILIFTTSAKKRSDAKRIERLLDTKYNICSFSLDLEDWEKILRIECDDVSESEVISLLKTINISAAVLNH